MDINWNRWIIEQLPFKLRTVLIFAFCKVINSHTVGLYGDFIKWKKKMRIHAGASPQVCMMKKIVRDEMDIGIQIEEGNGKPVDFIIKTSFSSVDKERQLFALLDRYKLAGKTYGYENAEIILSAVWNEYACERGDITSAWQKHFCELSEVSSLWSKYVCELTNASASWTGYVCELADMSAGWTNFACEKISKIDQNWIKCRQSGSYCYAKAQFPPESNLIITFTATIADENNGNIIKYEEDGYINKGNGNEVSIYWPHGVNVDIASLNIIDDNKYWYRITWL